MAFSATGRIHDGFGFPAVERGPIEQYPGVELPTQVPDEVKAGDLCIEMDSRVLPQLISGCGVSAQCEALVGSNAGSDAMKVAERPIVSKLEPDEMTGAMSSNEHVISQHLWNNMEGTHVSGPWGQQKDNHGYAERTALQYTARMLVGFSPPASHRVVVSAGSMKTRVGNDDLSGAA